MSTQYGGPVQVEFSVLGPVTANVTLKGPAHRAVLARLIVVRGRTVPVGHLVYDICLAPPSGAVV